MEHETCSICHQTFPAEDLTELDGQLICPDCFREEVRTCDHCGARILAANDYGDSSLTLCRHCANDYYEACCSCGRLVPNGELRYLSDDADEDFGYCEQCYREREARQGIHDYYYKPEPIFYGDGPRYFGVELEIDGGGESSSNAAVLLDQANQYGTRIYCKHDGSLDDGFEIVTHPMTLDYHLSEMPWQDILTSAAEMGYISHQAGTCGLHVHVSRTAFGRMPEQQDAAIARLLFFVEKFWDELLKFSRRTPRQLERWAARYGYKDHPRELLDQAKKNSRRDRYTGINLQPCDTVEFRIFRGTLKYNTLIATLQMVDRICDMAVFMSDAEVQALSWTSFVSGCTAPELVRYLKERRLYVNEPVDSEEEV